MKRRVVITGVGAITSLGLDSQTTWNQLLMGKNGISRIEGFDTTNFKVKLAGEIKDLDYTKYFSKTEIKSNDRFNLLSQISAREAMNDASFTDLNHDRFGVIFSSGIGGLITIDEMSKQLVDQGPRRISPYFIPKALINLAAGAIAIEHQAKGICTAHVSACAAGANCIGEAFHKIRDGYEDVILAGAGEASITPLGIAGFQAMRALHEGENSERASIPFDKERSGFVMGEGSACLVLETLEHAIHRKAKIYGEIVGYGASCDAYHITAPKDDGEGARRAMQRAIEDSNINASQIAYINAHGTSTNLNDKTESFAIKSVFHNQKIAVSSTKSSTGHLLGAAGALEAFFTIKVLEEGIIPSTRNYKVVDEDCDLDYVVEGNRESNVTYAMSNSLGFGGHNVSLVFKKWENSYDL